MKSHNALFLLAVTATTLLACTSGGDDAPAEQTYSLNSDCKLPADALTALDGHPELERTFSAVKQACGILVTEIQSGKSDVSQNVGACAVWSGAKNNTAAFVKNPLGKRYVHAETGEEITFFMHPEADPDDDSKVSLVIGPFIYLHGNITGGEDYQTFHNAAVTGGDFENLFDATITGVTPTSLVTVSLGQEMQTLVVPLDQATNAAQEYCGVDVTQMHAIA